MMQANGLKSLGQIKGVDYSRRQGQPLYFIPEYLTADPLEHQVQTLPVSALNVGASMNSAI